MVGKFRFFVGIDWASVEHEVCMIDAEGKIIETRSFKHSGDGLAELCAWMLKAGPVSETAAAIEVPHGSVVETLLDRGFAVFSLNPKQLDRFRDRFTVAGAKDDRLDAQVLSDSLRTDGHLFRQLSVLPAATIELREWSRIHDELQDERTALVNQMRAQFARFYPAFLDVAPDPGEDFAIRLFECIGDPKSAHTARRCDVRKILAKHRIRRLDADKTLELLRQNPVFSAPGTAGAAKAHLALLGQRVSLLNAQLRTCRAHLQQLLDEPSPPPSETTETTETPPGKTCEQRDAMIIQSMPGIGMIVAATLLGEAAEPLESRDYQALRALAGVAPVTRRSGKKCVVVMRTACHPRLRNAVYHWARVAAMHEPLSKARYGALRARGKSHGQALRSVADRLLRVLCAMLRTQTPFKAQPKAA
jgi:transposase